MAWYICLGTLAAFGCFTAIWCLLGWMLPPMGEVSVVCGEANAQAVVRRYLWLRGLGLIRCPLILSGCDLSPPERAWMEDRGIEVCSPEELSRRLGIGEKELGRTGNGDHPGRYQRRGVSEL